VAKYVERVWACDTMTGARLVPIPVSSFSYTRAMNNMASGTMTMNVNSKRASKLDLRTVLAETKVTLVLEADNQVVAAGVVGNTAYDWDAGRLTVDHADLWTILAARKAILHGIPNAMIAHLIVSGTMSDQAKQLIKEAVAPGSQYNLPLVLDPEEGGTQTQTYYGYAMQDVATALHEIMDSSGGPDIDMLPEWAPNGNLRWAPRIGDLTTGVNWEYNLDAARNGLSGVGLKTDATAITTNAYIIGEGSEKNTLYRSNPSPNRGYPALERDTAYKGVTSLGRLGALAVERTRAYAGPTKQWSVQIDKDGGGKPGAPRVQDLQLGDTVRIYSAADPWIPVGWSENRLIKFSGALESQFVSLEFQPLGG
jgi:hypothetical protein